MKLSDYQQSIVTQINDGWRCVWVFRKGWKLNSKFPNERSLKALQDKGILCRKRFSNFTDQLALTDEGKQLAAPAVRKGKGK